MKLLKDYIKVYNVDDDSRVLTLLESSKTTPGSWTDNHATVTAYQNMDTVICEDIKIKDIVTEWAKKVVYQYSVEFEVPIRGASGVRFNKYSEGQKMEMHFDHIHSVFDGYYKGIPILSIIGFLNDDYEGGELVFNLGGESVSYKLPANSILVFPSAFPWPHEVTPVTKGIRYTWVMWCF